MMDTIHISDLEIFARHGVAEEERILGQKFIADVLIWPDAEEAARRDEISLTVNYGEVCRFIEKEMQNRSDKLIETVAARLAEGLLLEFERIKKVRVEIKKPWAPIRMPVGHVSVCRQAGWHRAYIGAGSNLGKREDYLDFAQAEIRALRGIRNFKAAAVIETEPVDYLDQPDFLNTVYEIETFYSPARLLKHLQEIENEAGRTREIRRGPRTLDLDLLLYDDMVTDDQELVLPHPLMHQRKFVLEPLCELNPYGVHPLYRRRFTEMLQEIRG